ncbi:hypothetical protein TUM17387_08810 [Shewanella carassii]|nr:hypothetical protein TUM17387_08810 [Shewanella carassii]
METWDYVEILGIIWEFCGAADGCMARGGWVWVICGAVIMLGQSLFSAVYIRFN